MRPGNAIPADLVCLHRSRRPGRYGDHHAGQVSLPDRTQRGSAAGAGAHVRLWASGVQRRYSGVGRGIPCGSEDQPDRSAAEGDHTGENHRVACLAVRSGQCGVGAVGPGRTSGVLELLRLGYREAHGPQGRQAPVQVSQGHPTIIPAYPQRLLSGIRRPAVSGQDRECAGPLVTRPAFRTIVGHGHLGAGRALLCVVRSRGPADPASAGRAGGRGGSWNRETGHGRRYRWSAVGCGQPQDPSAQTAEAAQAGAGESASRQKQQEPSQVAAQDRRPAFQGQPDPAGLSPQAGPHSGPRQPSGSRRGFEHRRYDSQSSAGARHPRRRMGAVRADHRGESRPVRPDGAQGIPLVAQLQDLLGVRASDAGHAVEGPRLDLPSVRGGARPGSQRSQEHPRRRACGEAKRQWSLRKTTRKGGDRR
jgi:hypothetical protein